MKDLHWQLYRRWFNNFWSVVSMSLYLWLKYSLGACPVNIDACFWSFPFFLSWSTYQNPSFSNKNCHISTSVVYFISILSKSTQTNQPTFVSLEHECLIIATCSWVVNKVSPIIFNQNFSNQKWGKFEYFFVSPLLRLIHLMLLNSHLPFFWYHF